jgi:ribonuclease E
MNKFGMMGSTVLAASVAAVIWGAGPVRSTENLLARAQSEFAAKARDALIQRQMAQATMAPLVMAAPRTEAPSPYVVASLEPVAAPVVTREIRVEAPAPQPQAAVEPPTVAAAPVEAPITLQATVSIPAPAPAPAAEEAQETKFQMASLPEEPKSSVLPKQIAVAPVSEAAKTETPAVTRTRAEPRRKSKAERKTRQVQRERRTSDVYRAERPDRVARPAPRYATPYNLETLRARAPEIAAAIARYM